MGTWWLHPRVRTGSISWGFGQREQPQASSQARRELCRQTRVGGWAGVSTFVGTEICRLMLLAGHTATRQLKAHAPTCGAQRHIATLSPGCQHTSQTDSRPCHLHVQPLLQVDSTHAGTSCRARVQPWGSEDLAIPAALVLCHPPLWLCNVLMWLSTSLETPATMGHGSAAQQVCTSIPTASTQL